MNGPNKRHYTYYFDACIYLAYLRNEVSHYGTKIGAIGGIWEECQRGSVTILTSTITLTEVLSHKLESKSEKLFRQVTESGLHNCIDVDPMIAMKARELRDYYQSKPVKVPQTQEFKKHLTTPDALHLATALLYNADELLTFDGCRGKKEDNTIGLLWLGNKAGDEKLVIAEPVQRQGTLRLSA